MITRDINEVVRELSTLLFDKIYRIAKERQEEEIKLDFKFHNELYSSMEVYFPDDDEEFETTEDYLDEMAIVVNSEYLDDDGQIYEGQSDIEDLDLSVLLNIYNSING